MLIGASAGMICWFEAGVTDSFGPQLEGMRDGLGFLAGSACPHYDGEALRRPRYRELVAAGSPPGSPPTTASGCTTSAPSCTRSSPAARVPAPTASTPTVRSGSSRGCSSRPRPGDPLNPRLIAATRERRTRAAIVGWHAAGKPLSRARVVRDCGRRGRAGPHRRCSDRKPRWRHDDRGRSRSALGDRCRQRAGTGPDGALGGRHLPARRPGCRPDHGGAGCIAPPSQSLGSGFVIDKAGHIVTNNHVIAGARQVRISFSGTDEPGGADRRPGPDDRRGRPPGRRRTRARSPRSRSATRTPSRSATRWSRSATRSALSRTATAGIVSAVAADDRRAEQLVGARSRDPASTRRSTTATPAGR